MEEYEPHTIEDIPQFISIHGFKKSQFNDWLSDALKSIDQPLKTTGFVAEIVAVVKAGEEIDIHAKLLENGTLSPSELRRPIFAYMILQLIKDEVDFAAIGKIGIYLSFINHLTKEAKYKGDKELKKNLAKEFEFRNILHATAALWMYKRQQGEQQELTKANICRVLDGEDKKEKDSEILMRYKTVEEVKFLSHSYLGKNDNVLYFQHQSFAEILSTCAVRVFPKHLV